MNINNFLQSCQTRVNHELEQWLPQADVEPQRLHEAMRYSMFVGGKRIRPALVYATGIALDVAESRLDTAACAVELIHTFSLVHDDLPAMDDDDLRRGKATCHRAFDDATAILAGDALQSLAFACLVNSKIELSDAQRLEMIKSLSDASGSLGMAGGQLLDLAAVDQAQLTIADIETIHRLKTGALIAASIKLGMVAAAKCTKEQVYALEHYADCVGLAFQIQDDIIDIESSTAVLGKSSGADIRLNKATYPRVAGLENAKKRVHELAQQAHQQLTIFNETADALRMLTNYIVERSN